MQVIPVINCQDFDCVKVRVGQAQEFACDHGSSGRSSSASPDCWIHLDVADGGFTSGYSTWRNASDLKNLKRDRHVKFEAHLMVSEPEFILTEWLDAGVNRIIVHLETVQAIDTLVNLCQERGVEVWLAIGPATMAEHAFPYLALVAGCQVLAVEPGRAGQSLQPSALTKVQEIRKAFPKLPIEVDGGITLETAKQCAAAGATQVVAGTAIFTSSDPAAAYQELRQAAN